MSDEPLAVGAYSRHGDINAFLVAVNDNRPEFIGYREQWKRLSQPEAMAGPLLPAPMHLSLELVDACDMRCRNCFRSLYSQRGSGAVLPLDLFKRIADEGEEAGLKSLSMVWGEPLLYPHFGAAMSHLRDKRLEDVFVFCNGQLLDERKCGSVLECSSGVFTRLHVSLDAATPETYAKVRVEIWKRYAPTSTTSFGKGRGFPVAALFCLCHFLLPGTIARKCGRFTMNGSTRLILSNLWPSIRLAQWTTGNTGKRAGSACRCSGLCPSGPRGRYSPAATIRVRRRLGYFQRRVSVRRGIATP